MTAPPSPIRGDFPRDPDGRRRSCQYCDRGAFMMIGAPRLGEVPEPRCLHHLQGADSLSEDQRRVAEISRRARAHDVEAERSKR